MRLMIIASTAALLAASTALAQYNAPATPNANAPAATQPAGSNSTTNTTNNNNAPSNPAVKTTEGNNPGAPVPGANSFTEGQAKARIEARGYGNVTALNKDANGLWRGKAMKDGKAVNVTLDYQGNVTVE